MRFIIPMLKDGVEHKMHFSHIPHTISDWISMEEVNTWKCGDVVMICADTGTGKSHFLLNTMRGYFRENGLRVLYLTPRTRINEQFRRDLGNDSTVKVMSYQAIETIQSDPDRSLGKWDVIVCDEAHYFTNDSTFNYQTDISFDWVMAQKNAIKIFMTATHDELSQYLTNQGIRFTQYIIPVKGTLIESLEFFNSKDYIVDIAERVIASGSKAIFFIQSAQTAYDLYRKFEANSLFLCSRYNKSFSKYMDAGAIERTIEGERFDCNLLFATTALDAGVTIKDPMLDDIIIDIFDPVSIKQCIGRKRPIENGDAVHLHIRAYSNQQIGGIKRKKIEQAKEAQSFIKNGATAYSATHNRGNDGKGIVNDVAAGENERGEETFTKNLNEPKYNHIKQSIEVCKAILEHKDGYAGYVADFLGIDDYTILDDKQRKQTLGEYLNDIVGKPMLTRKEKRAFAEYLNVRGVDGKLRTTFRTLEPWIVDSGLPYRLHEYRTSSNVDGKKKDYRAWKVVRL